MLLQYHVLIVKQALDLYLLPLEYIEGRNLGFPALAVSMASHHPKHYDTGVKVVADLLKRLKIDKLSLPVNTILNINVPDCPWELVIHYLIYP